MLRAARHVVVRSRPKWGGGSIEGGHVAASGPSRALEWGKSCLTHGCSGALPRQGGLRPMGYVVACCCMPCFWS
jgi:hypothetical protein